MQQQFLPSPLVYTFLSTEETPSCFCMLTPPVETEEYFHFCETSQSSCLCPPPDPKRRSLTLPPPFARLPSTEHGQACANSPAMTTGSLAAWVGQVQVRGQVGCQVGQGAPGAGRGAGPGVPQVRDCRGQGRTRGAPTATTARFLHVSSRRRQC